MVTKKYCKKHDNKVLISLKHNGKLVSRKIVEVKE